MTSNLESTGASSSLTSRRPAANNLPSFELPAPFGQQYAQKFTPLPAINGTQSTQASVSVGNLLTPPSTVPGDNLSPISSALNSINPSSQGIPPYQSYAWPPLPTGLTPMGMGGGNTPQTWANSLNPGRGGMFSPLITNTLTTPLGRGNSNSPSATDGLPPPPYEMKFDMSQLPPLPTSMSMSAATSLPAITAQQQVMAYMNQTQTQTQTPVSATTQASPIHSAETYMQRPNSTPTYYSQSQPSSAHQSTFPQYNSNSPPIQQSPMSAPPQGSRISPPNAHPATFSPSASQSIPFGSRSTYGTYSLPAPPMSAPAHMSGPVMSNIHNPGNPMGLVSVQSHGLPGAMMPGYHSGHAAHLHQQMYGNPTPTPHNERPFKCDQCPQSFNRNHDLKRHKRIHLAVKPFPCGYCEKSFSRKDALKRHILVKGCGKSTSSNARDREDTPDPPPKDESDDTESTPTLRNSSV